MNTTKTIEAIRKYDVFGKSYYLCPDCNDKVGGWFDPVSDCRCEDGRWWERDEEGLGIKVVGKIEIEIEESQPVVEEVEPVVEEIAPVQESKSTSTMQDIESQRERREEIVDQFTDLVDPDYIYGFGDFCCDIVNVTELWEEELDAETKAGHLEDIDQQIKSNITGAADFYIKPGEWPAPISNLVEVCQKFVEDYRGTMVHSLGR